MSAENKMRPIFAYPLYKNGNVTMAISSELTATIIPFFKPDSKL